jgi:hypothetical protein
VQRPKHKATHPFNQEYAVKDRDADCKRGNVAVLLDTLCDVGALFHNLEPSHKASTKDYGSKAISDHSNLLQRRVKAVENPHFDISRPKCKKNVKNSLSTKN